MAAVDFTATYDITDPGTYERDYVPGVVQAVAAADGHVVVASGSARQLEGDAPSQTVVLRFPLGGVTEFSWGRERVCRLQINGIEHPEIRATWDPAQSVLHLAGELGALQSFRTYVISAELDDGRTLRTAAGFEHARLVPHPGQCRIG